MKIMENNELLQKLNDAEARIKELEDEKRVRYIKAIKRFGKYSDDELENEDLKTLEVIADAVSRFAPSMEEPELLPMPDKVLTRKEVRAATEKRDRDLESVFADVNAEFNMTNLIK